MCGDLGHIPVLFLVIQGVSEKEGHCTCRCLFFKFSCLHSTGSLTVNPKSLQ